MHESGLPPLSLFPDEPRDWGVSCDVCGLEMSPDLRVRMEDQLGRRHCAQCAAKVDRRTVLAAAALENAWQSILASTQTNFADVATLLRNLADTLDQLAQEQLVVREYFVETNDDQWRTWCTARPATWEPPWDSWPYPEAGDKTSA